MLEKGYGSIEREDVCMTYSGYDFRHPRLDSNPERRPFAESDANGVGKATKGE